MPMSRREAHATFGKRSTYVATLFDTFKRFEKEESGKAILKEAYLLSDVDDFAYAMLPILLQYVMSGVISTDINKSEIDEFVEYKGSTIAHSALLLLQRQYKQNREAYLKDSTKSESKGGSGKWIVISVVIAAVVFWAIQR